MNPLFFDELLLNIVDHLSFADIVNLRYINTNIDELVYWKSIERHKLLLSDSFLLKDTFEWQIEDPLQPLYDYLQYDNNICIAGGYPTLQYFNKNLVDFPDSDIDIYIFHNTSSPVTPKITFTHLLRFLDYTYTIQNIYRHGYSWSVFDIHLQSSNRILQIIGTTDHSLSEIIGQFDAAHNRCCYYLGHTYVTLDAAYAKTHQITYFTKNYSNTPRLDKASRLGLQIFHKPNYTQSNAKKIYSIFTNFISCNIADLYNKFSPVRSWHHDYLASSQHTLSVRWSSLRNVYVPINTRCVDVVRNKLYLTHDRLHIITQSPISYHYYLREFVHSNLTFNIVGHISTLSQARRVSIETSNIQHITSIKSSILAIYHLYYGHLPNSNVPLSYCDHLTIDDDRNVAHIFSCDTTPIRTHARKLSKYKHHKLKFLIGIDFRFAMCCDHAFFKRTNSWFNGINGSYGHVYYNILKVSICK